LGFPSLVFVQERSSQIRSIRQRSGGRDQFLLRQQLTGLDEVWTTEMDDPESCRSE
jgi:hypothetical protein